MHIISAIVLPSKKPAITCDPLDKKMILEEEQATQILTQVIVFFNKYPQQCTAMYRYLTTNYTNALDPSIPISWCASLRTMEYSINKVLKKSTKPIHLATFQSYQKCISAYTKKFFDIYRRSHWISLVLQTSQGKQVRLETSIAQLNLIKWILTYGKVCIAIATKESRNRQRIRI